MERKELKLERTGLKFKLGSLNLICSQAMTGGLRLAIQLADALIATSNMNGEVTILSKRYMYLDMLTVFQLMPNPSISKDNININFKIRSQKNIPTIMDDISSSFDEFDKLNVYIVPDVSAFDFENLDDSESISKILYVIDRLKKSNTIVLWVDQYPSGRFSDKYKTSMIKFCNEYEIDQYIDITNLERVGVISTISMLEDHHRNKESLVLMIDDGGTFRKTEKLQMSSVYGETHCDDRITLKNIDRQFRKYTCVITDELDDIIDVEGTIFLKDHHLCDHRMFMNLITIRITGLSVGTITIDDNNRIAKCKIDSGLIGENRLYPENINDILSKYIGKELIV